MRVQIAQTGAAGLYSVNVEDAGRTETDSRWPTREEAEARSKQIQEARAQYAKAMEIPKPKAPAKQTKAEAKADRAAHERHA